MNRRLGFWHTCGAEEISVEIVDQRSAYMYPIAITQGFFFLDNGGFSLYCTALRRASASRAPSILPQRVSENAPFAAAVLTSKAMHLELITAELVYLDGRFQRGCCVLVDQCSGLITFAGPVGRAAEHHDGIFTRRDLGRTALLPGMVNCHSHAFQIGLRGRGEAGYTPGVAVGGMATDDFWTWRQEMYRLVRGMDRKRMLSLTEAAFREMLRGGCTSVGEFHYFHHADGEMRDHAFDEVVVAAARAVGIRLVLLSAFYCRAAIAPAASTTGAAGATAAATAQLSVAQRRFNTPSVPQYFAMLDRIGNSSGGGGDGNPLLTVGVVAHSVRAASIGEIEELGAGALARGIPLHMHLEEQPKEIVDCCAATGGKTPLQLVMPVVARLGALFTAVHCTHSRAADLATLVGHGANVCVCPLTEGCLGDGLSRIESFGGQICLGTDCNARICLVEEMRWLEYGQRLKHCRRGMVVAPRPDTGNAAAELFRYATSAGAAALRLRAGVIEAHHLADFFTIDLEDAAFAPVRTTCAMGCGDGGSGDEKGDALEDVLLPAFVFGCAASAVVRDVCVNGKWVVERRQQQHGGGRNGTNSARPAAESNTVTSESAVRGRRFGCAALAVFCAAGAAASACR